VYGVVTTNREQKTYTVTVVYDPWNDPSWFGMGGLPLPSWGPIDPVSKPGQAHLDAITGGNSEKFVEVSRKGNFQLTGPTFGTANHINLKDKKMYTTTTVTWEIAGKLEIQKHRPDKTLGEWFDIVGASGALVIGIARRDGASWFYALDSLNIEWKIEGGPSADPISDCVPLIKLEELGKPSGTPK
jgi:hypothetical protein